MDHVFVVNRFPGSTTWRFDACSVNIWSKILILTVCQHWAHVDVSLQVIHLFVQLAHIERFEIAKVMQSLDHSGGDHSDPLYSLCI